MSVVCFSVVFGFLLPRSRERSQFREDAVSLHAVVDIGRERISSLHTNPSLCVCVCAKAKVHACGGGHKKRKGQR